MPPSRFGPRIVKGRTPAQQEQAEYYKQQPDSVVAILPKNFGAPSCSWWAGLSREEFDAVHAREQERMAVSRFGRVSGSTALE